MSSEVLFLPVSLTVKFSQSSKLLSLVAPVAVPAHLEALSQLDIPALFLYGSRDPMLRDRSKLMHLNPRIRTEVIEDAGHACYLDKPEKFHSILLNFLENLN